MHNLSSDMHEVQLPFILNPVTRHYRKTCLRPRAGIMRFFGVDKKIPIFVNEEKFLWPYSYYRKRRYREKRFSSAFFPVQCYTLDTSFSLLTLKTTISGRKG
uniref:Putative membrane protein n=1 Tax=Klebsiella pneumoniae TaxID=573 RepID=A0A8B0SXP3_KLEPN|nr:putative membrane protein [Klebsiella pneumoniae]